MQQKLIEAAKTRALETREVVAVRTGGASVRAGGASIRTGSGAIHS
jgi:hypothetical protein